MAKCGKGCMPECQYFTTGGCISPFNCPYKIETGYINSATSTPDSLTDLLIEFDEMGFAPTTPCPNSEEYAIGWRGKVRKEIERLKSENAALKERLEKAVELPCKRKRLLWGDKDKETLLCPDCLTDLMGGIGDETFVVQCPNCGCFVDCMVEPIPFTESAEARLKERQGGEQ